MNQKYFFFLYLILFISAISFFPYKKYNTLFAFRIDRFITNNFLGNDAYLYSIPKTKPITYSTSSDFCITPLFGAKEVFFDINLFSIRKSGCAATIIIITDNSTVFSENVKKLILLFNVQIVRGVINANILYRHTDFIRDTLLFYLLKELKKEMDSSENVKYDRIFFFDSYDVYFEQDPFRYFERDDRVYFFQESYIQLKRSCYFFNRRGVKMCFGEEKYESIKEKYVVCSGTIAAGSVDSFVRFLDFFVNLGCFKSSRCLFDQGALIYVVNSGMLNENNISFYVFPPEGPVATCRFGPIFTEFKVDDEKNVYMVVKSLINNHTYEVVHQYQKFRKQFYKKTLIKKYLNDHNISDLQIKISRIIIIND